MNRAELQPSAAWVHQEDTGVGVGVGAGDGAAV